MKVLSLAVIICPFICPPKVMNVKVLNCHVDRNHDWHYQNRSILLEIVDIAKTYSKYITPRHLIFLNLKNRLDIKKVGMQQTLL